MRLMRENFLTSLLLWVALAVATAGCDQRPQAIHFGGGPAGGTFQVTAEALTRVLRQHAPGVRFQVERSGGSYSNVNGLREGKLDLALIYGGDLGSHPETAAAAEQPRLLCRMYGAAAQLAVLASSRVTLPSQLKGARVAIGSSGSGAAQAAERYFRAVGIWDRMIPVYIGYDMAMSELLRGNVVAVWEMVGAPSPSLEETSRRVPLRLLNLQQAGRHGNFFAAHPYYRPMAIPAGTYPKQDRPVATFEDVALLAANARLAPAEVERFLAAIFSENGLREVRNSHPVLQDFGPEQALRDLPAPLHPGAVAFWRDRDKEIPPELLPPEESKKIPPR